jgi:radical SAM superfamily enzyme YgiQ (UPF0313 family)
MKREILPKGAPVARIAVGFANRGSLAANNLGFRTVAQLLDSWPGIHVERFDLPHGDLPLPSGSLQTEPSRARLSSMDLILFSLSFENDAIHVPAMLEAGGLPAFAGRRRDGHPLVVGGGAVVMMNPEPLGAFFDLFLVGEAEVLLEDFLRRWGEVRDRGRSEMITALAALRGAVAPALRAHRIWTPGAGRSLVADREVVLRDAGADSAPMRVIGDARSAVETVKWEAADTSVTAARLPPEAEFGESLLLELARGCRRRCRFCVSTRIYEPLRARSADLLLQEADRQTRAGETVGLLSLSAGDYRELEYLTGCLREMGLRISISSLPPTFARKRVVENLIGSGTTTLTLAPETGSDRLRALIGKPLRNDRILKTVEMLGRAGLRHLRTYFLIGLPFEEARDIRAIAELLKEMRGLLALGCSLSASVNAFVPKPRTPFQWAPMAPIGELREAARMLSHQAPWGVRVRIKSFRESRLQAVLSRGDVAWGARLAKMALAGEPLGAALKSEGLRVEDLTGPIALDSALPWDYLVDQRERGALKREWKHALDASRVPR